MIENKGIPPFVFSARIHAFRVGTQCVDDSSGFIVEIKQFTILYEIVVSPDSCTAYSIPRNCTSSVNILSYRHACTC